METARGGCIARRSALTDPRSEGRCGLCLDHAEDAGRDLDRVSGQSHGIPAFKWTAALYRTRDLRYQSDRTWLSIGKFRHRLVGRLYSAERDWRNPRCPIDDRLDGDVVRSTSGVC